MTRRHYSDEARAAALAVLDANGGNLTRAAREAGVPLSTLKHWQNDRDRAAPSEVRDAMREELRAMLGAAAGSLLAAPPSLMAASPKARAERRRGRAPSVGRASCVYLVACEGFHKVGVSSNLAARLCAMQSSCPFEIVLVSYAVVDGHRAALDLEDEIHGRFWHRRVRGEWFALSADDVAGARETLGGGHVAATG